MTTDPVCFMNVDEQLAADQGLASEEQGQTFYFCSQECKHQFDENPSQFIGPAVDWEKLDADQNEDYAG